MTPGSGVIVDVHAAGVSFPEVLQTRGLYQIKPALPFIPGSEVGGVVRCAPEGRPSRRATGSRRSACSAASPRSSWRPAFLTFKVPDELDFGQAAALSSTTTPRTSRSPRGRLRRARRCSSTAPQAASGPRRCRSPRASARARSPSSRPTTRSASPARRAPTRSSAPTARGRTRPRSSPARGRRHRARPGRRRPLHRQPALAARRRPRSSSASPAARSPRSGSTGCCSTTSRSSAPAGAPT